LSRSYCEGEDVCDVGFGRSVKDFGRVASNFTIVNSMRREILFRLEPVSIKLIRKKQLNTIVTESFGNVARFVCCAMFVVEDRCLAGLTRRDSKGKRHFLHSRYRTELNVVQNYIIILQ
jgi:hypothetical protein